MDVRSYDQVRPLLRSGDCVLWRSRGLVPWIIQRFTEYSHAALVVRLDEYEGLRDRVFLVEAVGSGVELRLLSERLPRDGRGRAYVFQPQTLRGYSQDWIRAEALTLAARGVGYDFKGLFGNLLGRVSTDAQRYFCSELVWNKWHKAGVLRANNLRPEGVEALRRGKAPRPGDIPDWMRGDTTEVTR